MTTNFVADGIPWSVPCKIVRTMEIKGSAVEGMMMDLSWFNDPLGTWLVYTIVIPVPANKTAEYCALYELLSNPVTEHSFTLPYNDGHYTFSGRVRKLQDNWHKMYDGNAYWECDAFEITPNAPYKKIVNGQIVIEGITA